MRVAFFSTKPYDVRFFNFHNKEHGHTLDFFEANLNENTTNLVDGHRAVCLFVNDKLSDKAIEKLSEKGVEILALRSAGFNHVDVKAALDRGMTIVRVPAYSPHAVAEHALAIILTLNRKTHKAYNRVRESNFSLDKLLGFDLYGKTAGVIGTGKIGKAFCEIMLGLGCRVMAYDPFPDDDLKEKKVQYVSLEELLAQSDIVSLHCPLTPQTRYIINRDSLKVMKDGAMLINTSRGALVDTQAAIEALRGLKLGYLGIDVYEQEENLFFEDLSDSILQDEQILQLITFPNVLITSHQSFFTKEAMDQIAQVTLQNLSDAAAGKLSGNEVTLP